MRFDIREYTLECFVILIYLFLLFLLPTPTFDWGSYVVWAEYIRTAGLDKIYLLPYVNYMPINIFALHIWQLAAGAVDLSLDQTVHWVKLYPLVFDCLSVLLLLRIAKKLQYSRMLTVAVTLPNIAFHYNSLIWGQFDSVYTFFVLASVYTLTSRRYGLAALMFLLALNGKLQAIIFLPLVLAFGLVQAASSPQRGSKTSFSRGLLYAPTVLGGFFVLQWLLFAPFSQPSPTEILSLIWSRSVSLSNFVTFNADNFWVLAGVVTMRTLDSQAWLGGVAYKTWGYLLFFITSGIALLPLGLEWLAALKARKTAQQPAHFQLAVITSYLISVNFFFFLTQMHERYVHPSILFATLLTVIFRRPWILILTSMAYVLNMERINHFWLLTPILEESFDLAIISATLFSVALGFGYILLFKTYFQIYQRKIMQ